MKTTYRISPEAIQQAIYHYGMKGMTRGELGKMIVQHKNIDQFSSQVVVAAARRTRFVKRVMGWP